MWGSERQGAFANALGSHHGSRAQDPGRVTCFCKFCRDKAAAEGIRTERARTGFLELDRFVRSARSGMCPATSYFPFITMFLVMRMKELTTKCLIPASPVITYSGKPSGLARALRMPKPCCGRELILIFPLRRITVSAPSKARKMRCWRHFVEGPMASFCRGSIPK
jgi:hypothetical protein